MKAFRKHVAESIDGCVGSYANPCYIAAYESRFCLGWKASDTTLISIGTGRDPNILKPGDASKFMPRQWISPVIGAFLQTADDQQVHLVNTFFEELDFRRFQVDFSESIKSDDPGEIPKLAEYGEELGRKIINDETDLALDVKVDTVKRVF